MSKIIAKEFGAKSFKAHGGCDTVLQPHCDEFLALQICKTADVCYVISEHQQVYSNYFLIATPHKL